MMRWHEFRFHSHKEALTEIVKADLYEFLSYVADQDRGITSALKLEQDTNRTQDEWRRAIEPYLYFAELDERAGTPHEPPNVPLTHIHRIHVYQWIVTAGAVDPDHYSVWNIATILAIAGTHEILDDALLLKALKNLAIQHLGQARVGQIVETTPHQDLERPVEMAVSSEGDWLLKVGDSFRSMTGEQVNIEAGDLTWHVLKV